MEKVHDVMKYFQGKKGKVKDAFNGVDELCSKLEELRWGHARRTEHDN